MNSPATTQLQLNCGPIREAIAEQAARALAHDDIAMMRRLGLLLVTLSPGDGQDEDESLEPVMRTAIENQLRPQQQLLICGGTVMAVVVPGADIDVMDRVAVSVVSAVDEAIATYQRGQAPPAAATSGAPAAARSAIRSHAGAACCVVPHDDPQLLIPKAQQALQTALTQGSEVEHFAVPSGHHTIRSFRAAELKAALRAGDLHIHLQPQVDLRTGQIVGAEALARLVQAENTVMLPAHFLPLATRMGLLPSVTTTVMGQAMAAVAQWWPQHQVPVSVNVSAHDVLDGHIHQLMQQGLRDYQIPPQALRIELTEEAFVTNPQEVADLVTTWRQTGFDVAVDDFGTGYSALAYLRIIRFGELKLDKVFVADLPNPATVSIVRHVCALAHELGMRVVAEGVATQDIADQVAALGCDIAQGDHFGPAMPVADFVAALSQPPPPAQPLPADK